jgi:hypothetical protein
MSIERTEALSMDVSPNHGTEDSIESGEANLHESTPFLYSDEEAEDEEISKKPHGPGFFWIQAGMSFFNVSRTIGGFEATSLFRNSANAIQPYSPMFSSLALMEP